MFYDANSKVEISFLRENGEVVTVVFTRQIISDLTCQAMDQDCFNFVAALDYLGIKYRIAPETKFWRVFDEWNCSWKKSPIKDDDMDTACVVGVINGGEVGETLFNQLVATCGVEVQQ